MKFPTCFVPLTLAAVALAPPAFSQVGGPGDLSPHIDIGVDAGTGQLVYGFTDFVAGTPIVLDRYVTNLPTGSGGGFANVQFTPDQDIAFRTASASIASGFGFSSFGQFGQSTPSIAAEAVEFDPLFESYVFPDRFVTQPGDAFILNIAGAGIDFHPFYFVASDDPDYIGRVEGSFRFVPLTSTGTFSASEPFELVFVVGGDFDDDSRLTDDDQNLIQAAIDGGTNPAEFDLTGDALVDDADLTFWRTELLGLPATITGDYNADGFVSQPDLDLVLLNWGDTDTPDNFDLAALPGGGPFDNLISQNELDGVLLNWGDGTPPSVSAIPEPGTAAALAGLALVASRRRR